MTLLLAAHAQIQDPVKFKTELKTLSDTEGEIIFTGTIDRGWHVYSTDLGDGGPISATFNVDKMTGAELVGKLKPVGKEVSTFDKLFEMKVRYFENTAQFVQKIKFTAGTYDMDGYLEKELVTMKVAFRLLRFHFTFPVRPKVIFLKKL